LADISDVENAIVILVSSVLYPNGTTYPSALPGASPVVIHRGWPLPTDLDRDIPAGKSHVSVFTRGGEERNTTRYNEDWQEVSRDVATLTAVVQNNTIAIGGNVNVAVPQFVTIQIGPRFVTSYAPVQGDGIGSVAQALAARIGASFAPASETNGVISVQSGASIRAMVGVTGVQEAEIKRQQSMVQITLWCPTPAIRDSLAKLLDPVFAATTFLVTPDQAACRFRYNNTLVSDAVDKEKCYRRDIIYTVEYPTLLSDTAFEITVVDVNQQTADGSGGIAASAPTYLPLPPGSASPLPSKTAPYVPLNQN
jgi:hypothetical protein